MTGWPSRSSRSGIGHRIATKAVHVLPIGAVEPDQSREAETTDRSRLVPESYVGDHYVLVYSDRLGHLIQPEVRAEDLAGLHTDLLEEVTWRLPLPVSTTPA